MKFLWLFVCLAVARGQGTIKRDKLDPFCPGPPEKFFQCDESRCLNRLVICDGRKDCSDNWDEENCSCTKKKDCPAGIKCQKDRIWATSKCVNCAPGQRFTKFACEDINKCMENPNVCSGKGECVALGDSFQCVQCPRGFQASLRDSRLYNKSHSLDETETARRLLLCADRNECEERNACDDGVCFNRIGESSCQCPPNHEMRSDFRDNICQAVGEQPMIAIGSGTSISIFDLRSATEIQQLEWSESIVDVSAELDKVIFATRRQIWEYKYAVKSTLMLADFESDRDFSDGDIKEISVDWENHRVYVLTGDSIVVVDAEGRAVRIIEHRGNVSSIAVDPVAGYVFYSESGNVRRCHLDGFAESTRTVFTALPAGDDLQGTDAVAIDPNLKYAYYIHNRVLYGFDYDGHRSAIISASADYTHLGPFEDLLYATNRLAKTDSLVVMGRIGYSVGAIPESTVQSFGETLPMSFAIIQSAKFPLRPKETNSCNSEPCSSEWCFPMPLSVTPSYHCDCGLEKPGDCLPLKTHRLRPFTNYISPNEEKINVSGASVPITARISNFSIIIPIVLVHIFSLACFK
ncbi:very low-density lipoprotein receptor [Galendromus occidentalis]|uniref:Very low-density lipoprotein receptor n=1 Tax=Galendromus occidentalis TaxID=34638 RepID=A0AAJ6QQP9_9ACAR|nr:very low-density lipoprotein receptor [Galendromus occidentalis]